MPLTGRIGKFCDDVCFIWHVWRLFRMMCRRFGFGMIGVSYGDLCHYGWNVWNAFKGATNRFYDQTELAEWLKASFESLAKYNTKTLRAKLRATDGGYRIRLIDNLKEYIQK